MAAIEYPTNLPGALVNSSGYRPKDLVERNDLSSGPPLFIQKDDSGWVMFDVVWSFSALDVQVFRNWYRRITTGGAKLFNIDLYTDAVRTHECYFNGVPQYQQNGKRFRVTATLLAIEEVGIFDEEDATSLITSYNGFAFPLDQAILSLDEVIKLMEELWQP